MSGTSTYGNAPRYAADRISYAARIAIDGTANAPTNSGDLVASLYAKISNKSQSLICNDNLPCKEQASERHIQ